MLLALHAFATLYMTGLIWFVQLVHYPLMGKVGDAGYVQYQRLHERYTGWAVGPALLVEMVTAVLLVILRPAGYPAELAWVGLAMVALLWLSTAFVQVPCHRRLGAGFDPAAHRRLVVSNWVRTALWTGRGVLVAWAMAV
jgi:uncharacterized membrane protein